MERPHRVWLYPLTIFFVCAIMIGLIANTALKDPVTAALGLIVPLIAPVIYEFLFRKEHDRIAAQNAREE